MRRVLLGSCAAVLLTAAGKVQAQSALDGFDPNANGTIRAVVVQPDGKILIGGDFTMLSPNGVNPITRNQIARLNPDGTVDAAFDPNANGGVVYAIALQSGGKILVGGVFSNIGGQPRSNLARLDPVTGAADSFNPNPNSDVLSIAVQTNGFILVGGDFNQSNGTPTIGGQTRNNIARLNPTTGLADSFNPNANSTVDAIVSQADGNILVGGAFSGVNSIGGATRNHIARLNFTTGLADSFDPNANGNVYAIALQADGKILVGGAFFGTSSIGGQPRNRIARLDPVTGAADSFNPNANGQINTIAIQPDGKILVGGLFTGANSIGGEQRSRIARLDPTTGLVDLFDPTANGPVLIIAVQSDGKILAGGQFTTLGFSGGVTRNHIARLYTDGGLDQTPFGYISTGSNVTATAVQPDGRILIGGVFSRVASGATRNNIARFEPSDGEIDSLFHPDANDAVDAIAVQADGKVLVGGDFTTLTPKGGAIVTRNHIARLNPDGTLDTDFNPNANGGVRTITVQADGKILVGGFFTTLSPNGGVVVSRNRIARLKPDGTLDIDFNPNANGGFDGVQTIAVQADGKILVGGFFTNIGGQPRNHIARLDATSGAADSFDPNPDGDRVDVIAVQADGKILASGSFTSIGGQPRNHIARLDATTGAADSFNPNADGLVETIAMQADGKILAGGLFGSIGGQTRNRIARLNPDGTLDTDFNPNANGGFGVYTIALQADGKVLAGGDFTNIGGQNRNLFARLSNNTAALQNLNVTQSTTTWVRGGSSPQFSRVTFESSTDDVNYAPLGNGTATGSNWSLTGFNLPTGQNIYIRARGYYRGGEFNGSESLTEAVQNAFIAPARPNLTTIAASNVGATSATLNASVNPNGLSTSFQFTSDFGSFPVQNAGSGTANVPFSVNVTGLSPNTQYHFNTTATNAGGTTQGVERTFTTLPDPTPTPTPRTTPTATPTATPGTTPGLVANVSTRLPVGTGDNLLIEGFTVQGPAGSTKKIIVRAIGPSLAAFGIIDALPNPTLEIHDANNNNAIVATNDDWKVTQVGGIITADQSAEISASGFAPGNDLESAIIANLPPGSYTGVVRGAGNSVGTAVVDAFDLSPAASAKLVNIATRGLIQPGDGLMIGGFIIQNGSVKAVVLAIGPSLAAFGITNALSDTTLQLRDGNGALVVENDDWKIRSSDGGSQQAEIEATGLQPTNDRESAVVTTLPPGQYTAQVRGKPETTGTGVVQVYFLP